MTSDTCKFFSLNVKGLNSPIKRNLLFKTLKSDCPDVVFLQETHFTPLNNFKFFSSLYPRSFSSSHTRKRAGAAILLSDTCSFILSDVFLDTQGRYVLLMGTWLGKKTAFCNVYAPNSGQISFLNRIIAKLCKWSPANLVIGGDFNVPFSPWRDHLYAAGRRVPKATEFISRAFCKLIRQQHLFDVWRISHPSDNRYTFYSSVYQTHTRIDYLSMLHF